MASNRRNFFSHISSQGSGREKRGGVFRWEQSAQALQTRLRVELKYAETEKCIRKLNLV